MATSPESKGVAASPHRAAASSLRSAGSAAAHDANTFAVDDAAGAGAPSTPTFTTPTRPVVPKLTREGYYMVRGFCRRPLRTHLRIITCTLERIPQLPPRTRSARSDDAVLQSAALVAGHDATRFPKKPKIQFIGGTDR